MSEVQRSLDSTNTKSKIVELMWRIAELVTRLTGWYIFDIRRIAWDQKGFFLNVARVANSQSAWVWLNYAQKIDNQKAIIWISIAKVLLNYQLHVLGIMLAREWSEGAEQDQLVWLQFWEVSKIQRLGIQWWKGRKLQQLIWLQEYWRNNQFETEITGCSLINLIHTIVLIIGLIWSLRIWWWWTMKK